MSQAVLIEDDIEDCEEAFSGKMTAEEIRQYDQIAARFFASSSKDEAVPIADMCSSSDLYGYTPQTPKAQIITSVECPPRPEKNTLSRSNELFCTEQISDIHDIAEGDNEDGYDSDHLEIYSDDDDFSTVLYSAESGGFQHGHDEDLQFNVDDVIDATQGRESTLPLLKTEQFVDNNVHPHRPSAWSYAATRITGFLDKGQLSDLGNNRIAFANQRILRISNNRKNLARHSQIHSVVNGNIQAMAIMDPHCCMRFILDIFERAMEDDDDNALDNTRFFACHFTRILESMLPRAALEKYTESIMKEQHSLISRMAPDEVENLVTNVSLDQQTFNPRNLPNPIHYQLAGNVLSMCVNTRKVGQYQGELLHDLTDVSGAAYANALGI